MKIASQSLEMSTQYRLEQSLSYRESFNQWQNAAPASSPAVPQDDIQLSDAGKVAAESDPAGDEGLTPSLALLRNILEKTFGIRIHLGHIQQLMHGQNGVDTALPAQPASQPPAAEATPDWGARWEREFQYSETESFAFSAKGNITTRDGQAFSFELNVSMQRSFQISSSEQVRLGAAAKDPLMITLGQDAGTLSGATVSFDLDGDGQGDRLPMSGNGGWLALDRNDNGRIDQRSELFGPVSGDGFGELAALDADGNGAIDEGDPLFARLRLWQGRQGEQDQLTPLSDVGIGALLLPHVAADYHYRQDDGQTAAQLRKVGVYLQENGQAGLISQLDINA